MRNLSLSERLVAEFPHLAHPVVTYVDGDCDGISLQLDALMSSPERKAQYRELFGEEYQTMADCAMLLDCPSITAAADRAARSILATRI